VILKLMAKTSGVALSPGTGGFSIKINSPRLAVWVRSESGQAMEE